MVTPRFEVLPPVLVGLSILGALTLTGGWLFLLGWQRLVKDPNARYGPAVGAALASLLCFPFVTGILFLLLFASGTSIVLGGLASVAAGLGTTLALISGITQLKCSKPALASIPMLALPVLLAVLCVVGQAISFHHKKKQGIQAASASNLYAIHCAISMYATDLTGVDFPPDLQTLVELEYVPPRAFKSPGLADNGREFDYFYLPPEDGFLGPSQALVACSYADCLEKERRVVLRVSGETARLTREQFEAELAKPENATVAAALRAEGARLGIAQGR